MRLADLPHLHFGNLAFLDVGRDVVPSLYEDGGTLAPSGAPDMAAQEFGTAIQGRPPMIQGDQAAAINRNTDPRFPANPENPAVGINKGIETQESDSVITK